MSARRMVWTPSGMGGSWSPVVHATRFAGIAYTCHGSRDWRICDPSNAFDTFGPRYASKAELLADLHRFAVEYGAAS